MNSDTEQYTIDPESERSLRELQDKEKIRTNKIAGVKTILIVLSSRAMALDRASLTQKVMTVYPQAAVFFRTTQGKPIGVPSPSQVDLLINFAGPKERQGFFFSRKLKGMGVVTVGRKTGYQRMFHEPENFQSLDMLARERIAQREVLALAGVPLFPSGDVLPDRGKLAALDLPPLRSGA